MVLRGLGELFVCLMVFVMAFVILAWAVGCATPQHKALEYQPPMYHPTHEWMEKRCEVLRKEGINCDPDS